MSFNTKIQWELRDVAQVVDVEHERQRGQQRNRNWRKWIRSVWYLRPDDRWLLEHGGIDPNRQLCFRYDLRLGIEDAEEDGLVPWDSCLYHSTNPELRSLALDDKEHSARFNHAAPLCFLGHWVRILGQLRPPPEHAFHRFWKRRRQQEMGLVTAPAPAVAAIAAGNRGEEDERNQVPQSQQPRQPGLTQPEVAASTSEEVEDEDELQPSRMAHELQLLLHDPRYVATAYTVPLSLEEQRELAPLLPGGQYMSLKELTTEVQRSKTRLIRELVLEDRVRTLLEFGADPNPEKATVARYIGTLGLKSPLAVELCPPSVARMLLEAKADPNLSLLHGEKSALWAYYRNPDILRLLLEAGANPHHRQLEGRQPALSDPVQECLFLSFVGNDAPMESLRLLLEYNAEIIGQDGSITTPVSAYILGYIDRRCIQDLVLSIPYPIPENCSSCGNPRSSGCWGHAALCSPEFLPMLVRMGYPTRGCLQGTAERVRLRTTSEERFDSEIEILLSVTEEGQAQRRQEYLGGFWLALMRAVPSLSGVVTSLVLQAIVPEFQLRIA